MAEVTGSSPVAPTSRQRRRRNGFSQHKPGMMPRLFSFGCAKKCAGRQWFVSLPVFASATPAVPWHRCQTVASFGRRGLHHPNSDFPPDGFLEEGWKMAATRDKGKGGGRPGGGRGRRNWWAAVAVVGG